MKKKLLTLALGCAFTLGAALGTGFAQATPDINFDEPDASTEGEVNLNTLEIDTSYVFSSGIEFASKEVGRGSAMHNFFEYIRRVPIQGQWYFQVGATYDRFDFGGSATSLLPTTLQSINVPVGISYIFEGHVGFLAQVRPGLNFEHDITSGAFDIPFEIGSFYPFIDKKLYGVWGAATSILRDWPVIPMVGIIWIINDDFRVMGYLPEPKIIYQANENLEIWVGGEFIGGSYKVGRRADSRLSNTVVDYTEYRVGAGFTYEPRDNWEITLAGGCAIDREFDFHRANQVYSSDAAPYIRFQVSGEF
ncbi:MAG TPA: hypothetical protein VNQ90_04830 [Chthoniobacteraceae bacterium]|nr:hypothetical protein [Chthoniobacteraceae bacterium]